MPTKPKKYTEKQIRFAENRLRSVVADEIERQDHSIRQVAAACDLDPETISRWLSGERSMRVRDLATVMDYLGMKIVRAAP